ncbi:MAG: cell division protein FtsA [Alphaproteobacteria bacterium]|nr:MAG: cell division protein FtsA [Alphaproteobacteria bacterium]
MKTIHESQRAMRAKRQAAIDRGVVAVLDIGSSKFACLILRFDGGAMPTGDDGIGSLAGQSGFRVIGAATTRARGVRFGEIHASPETERAIRTVVQAAQKMAGVRVDHVIVTLAGARPRSYGLTGEIDLDGTAVTEADVGRVLSACDLPDIGADREVLHAQPVNFAVDHRTGLLDPRGQIGHRLTTDMHLVTIDATAIKTLCHCVQRCDLELAGIASSAYVSGIAALTEDEQELGAACVDMGGGATGVSIFLKKHMIYVDSVRMGGDHVTGDIASGFRTSRALAERIKAVNGGVVATGQDDRDFIAIDEADEPGAERRTISRTELIGVMRPRVEEILEEVRASLDAAGFEHLPSQRIVLTGGASQIPGIESLAERILGPYVRLGRPLRVQGLPQAATGPAFSSIVGLCLFAAYPQDEWWDFELPTERYPARSLRRALKWFRENW